MFGLGIWWSGFDLKRLGSADHAVQMASLGAIPRRVLRHWLKCRR